MSNKNLIESSTKSYTIPENGDLCMTGTLHSDQKCRLCGSTFKHDMNRQGLFCPNHPEEFATGDFQIRLGTNITRRRQTYYEAYRILTGYRYEKDHGKFDERDYIKVSTLRLPEAIDEWLTDKKGSEITHKHVQAHINHMSRAIEFWGDIDIKLITTREVRRFLSFPHKNKQTGEPLSAKTKNDIRSSLHDLLKWHCDNDETMKMPKFPKKLRKQRTQRNILTIEEQEMVLQELKRISYDINPKIWLGVLLLTRLINTRPGELIKVREKDILLDSRTICIRETKEDRGEEGKFGLLAEDDIVTELGKHVCPSSPELRFFRHNSGRGGVKVDSPFGDKYLKTWWDKACENLGIQGVDLYGGTRHTTIMALIIAGYSPEEVQRGGAETKSQEAMLHYMPHHPTEKTKIASGIAKLHASVSKNPVKTVQFQLCGDVKLEQRRYADQY